MPDEPLTTCGACGQRDDHPKHQIAVGFNNEHTQGLMFHPHDIERSGVIAYHFDCPTPWHAAEGVDASHHEKVAALARSGVRGDALRARIVSGEI